MQFLQSAIVLSRTLCLMFVYAVVGISITLCKYRKSSQNTPATVCVHTAEDLWKFMENIVNICFANRIVFK